VKANIPQKQSAFNGHVRSLSFLSFFCLLICASSNCLAAGVTVITHGYNSDVNSWVTAMADRIPDYYRFPGTNFTVYKITLTTDGSSYFYQWERTNGGPPSVTDSGEIIVKLDWSQMAGGLSAPYDISTYNVAQIASFVLLQTNSISDLGGHALAEYPLHLIGHSRGGSLVSEISRLLGTNGVWIDQLTTLDPHPLNNDGNSEIFFPTDASAKNTYVNVLFHDNYWQNVPDGLFDFNGESVSGGYNRYLDGSHLIGGYNNTSAAAPYHSNVHLWYHGTLDWLTPTTDKDASITSVERTNWWVAYEVSGVFAGFYYSLIGGGDRLSADQPVGPGSGAIRDGFNQWWDLGAGTTNNRTALSTNYGNWPNLIRFNRTATNPVVQGQSTALKFYYQWARPVSSNAIVSLYLDDDLNPLNTNQTLLRQIVVPANGASSVSFAITNLTLFGTNAAPGFHTFLAKITGGGRTRYLYAPEPVEVLSNLQPPVLDIAKLGAAQFRIGVSGLPGQTIILQNSTNLSNWLPLATNILATNRWLYTNTLPANTSGQFYRAVLGQ
jgi:hypothetical protein